MSPEDGDDPVLRASPSPTALRHAPNVTKILLAVWAALVAVSVSSATALACGFDLVTVSRTAREADRVVVGMVANRVGLARFTYTIDVEQVVKGRELPARWVIRDAGARDCGMPSLDIGERVVLEYYRPGRITTGPWFYALKIEKDGKVAFDDSHQPPLPRTLDDLLALYEEALPPDTSTVPSVTTTGSESRPLFAAMIAIGALLAAAATLRRSRRAKSDPL
jgi:hypothetical protein